MRGTSHLQLDLGQLSTASISDKTDNNDNNDYNDEKISELPPPSPSIKFDISNNNNTDSNSNTNSCKKRRSFKKAILATLGISKQKNKSDETTTNQ